MMGGMFGNAMGFGMILVWIFWLVILVAIVYGAISLLRPSGTQTPNESSETPLSILKRRYAAGEIDQAQFETIKGHLS